MSKKVLVAVSFGTSFPDAICGIENVENRLREAFPEYRFFRAFTSGVVSARIERDTGVHIPGVPELMEYLYREGFDEVRCQSLHIMSGEESPTDSTDNIADAAYRYSEQVGVNAIPFLQHFQGKSST